MGKVHCNIFPRGAGLKIKTADHSGRGLVVVIPMSADRWPQFYSLVRHIKAVTLEKTRIVAAVAMTVPGKSKFNRGRTKNVGYLESDARWSDTIVFHDVDIVPGRKCKAYTAVEPGTVRHAYGHVHCLGGVVFIQSIDFVRAGGFPNGIWGWGGEDRQLEQAVLRAGLVIDRSNFVLRFRGCDFFETASDGTVQAHNISKNEFARKTKPVRIKLPPCDLSQTIYTIKNKYHMKVFDMDVMVVEFY